MALVFGPENGAVSEGLVYEAAREDHAKRYTHLSVMGFAIQPNARRFVEASVWDHRAGTISTLFEAGERKQIAVKVIDDRGNELLLLNEATRVDHLSWQAGKREDELMVAVTDRGLRFVLSMSRNPYEIRLHCRTKDRDVGLVRLDNHCYHFNPDGTEIHHQPHLHVFREGFDLRWAEPVTWYDLKDPYGTLEHFLKIIEARFPKGIQLALY